MDSHLDIELDGKRLLLPPDFSIDIEDKNPLFNSVEMFSYPVEIPLDGNRSVLYNMDDVNSDMRPLDIERKEGIVIAEGMPFRSGTVVTQDDEEVNGAISLNIDASTQSFSDLISGLKCRDIPVKDKIKIGEKIGNVKVKVNYDYRVKIKYGGKKGDKEYYSNTGEATGTCEPQALGYSYPGECQVASTLTQVAIQDTTRDYPNGKQVVVPKVSKSFINVSDAYGENGAKYCNARVCYKHYALAEDGSTSSDVVAAKDSKGIYEDHYPYWVLDANRPQSGICFYVLYFLDCLFDYLGVTFDNTVLRDIGDMNRLCFFTTHCKYDTEPIYGSESAPFWSEKSNFDEINRWLSSRGCGGRLEIEKPEPKSVTSFHYNLKKRDGTMLSRDVVVGKEDVASITITANVTKTQVSANVLAMYANSMNFPDATVSDVIESLEHAFGIRFHYDYEQRRVTAYLLRDVFRSGDEPIPLSGRVLSMVAMSDKITGFRMRYASESDAKEQLGYLRDGKKDYDTTFDYIDYPKAKTVTSKVYTEFFYNLSATDDRVYIDLTTGNAYRVKVDQDATTASQLRPVLFEVGQYKGVEMGDCSSVNEDYIDDHTIGFNPVVFSDVNYQNELMNVSSSAKLNYTDSTSGDVYEFSNFNKSDTQPILSAFVDEDMEHEFVEQRIRNAVSSPYVDLYLTEVLNLVESYDPTGTDDGNSPLQSYDWGLSVAIMRGGGVDAQVQSYDYNYDGFGNSKWRTVAGEYALTSDSIDQMGNDFDYNGAASGIGNDERFSLKIRAYKQPAWAEEPLCNADEIDPATRTVTRKVRSRGLFDSFMAEYAHFMLHRKKYKVTMLASVAQVADVPNHWRERFEIDGKVGWINKMSYNIDRATGLGPVEIEFYAM